MIDVTDVSVELGGVDVLDGVSCRVDRGELVGLIGPNGAGKTTLLRTVNGILEPGRGRVRLDGDPVEDLASKAVSRRVATVPQNTHLGFAFTAESIVQMGRTPHRSRLDWSEDGDAVEAALERTETLHLRDRSVEDLSGGERQRVLLARALAQDTPGLVLDEPTASLDVNHQIRVLEIVRDLVDEDRAALAAIHDLDLAARYCDRLLLLHGGTIRARGRPEAVLAGDDLGAAFQTATAVLGNPVTGTRTVTPVGDRPDRSAHVHVVGTGRAAAETVGTLWRVGFEPTLGPVPEGDVAAELARDLGLEAVHAPAFSRPDATAVDVAETLVGSADVVLTTGGRAERTVADAVDDHAHAIRLEDDATPDEVEAAAATLAEAEASEVPMERPVGAVLAHLARGATVADD